jgi:hypothetical protein
MGPQSAASEPRQGPVLFPIPDRRAEVALRQTELQDAKDEPG